MSAASIAAIIRDGVPGTAMPAWRALLDADDVDYLVAVLRGGR